MSRNIKVWVEAEIHPTAYEIADVFWAMDSEEQAGFFSRLGEIAQERLVFQLQSVTDQAQLSDEGRLTMAMIGDYAYPSSGPDVAGLVEALEKYESAFEELFAQCCSNPITNAWGKPVSTAALNDAHSFASSRLAAHRKQKEGEA